MRPNLYSLHAFGQAIELHSYGVAIAVGFIVAIVLGVRQARRVGEDWEAVQDLCFWLLVTSLVGARLVFVLTNLGSFARACAEAAETHATWRTIKGCTRALHVWEGGLVFYGGLLAAIGFAVWFARRRALSFPRVADVLAPAVALGHFFGRLGCFAAGCCWGAPAGPALGVAFPPESVVFRELVAEGQLAASAPATGPLHPVQLYEAAGNLVLFFGLSWLATRKRFHGQVFVVYLFGYALLRFTVEGYRGDAVRRFLFPGLSTSRAIALATFALAVWLAVVFRRRALSARG